MAMATGPVPVDTGSTVVDRAPELETVKMLTLALPGATAYRIFCPWPPQPHRRPSSNTIPLRMKRGRACVMGSYGIGKAVVLTRDWLIDSLIHWAVGTMHQ